MLDNLAAGLSPEEIVASYPPLGVDDVRAATAYAADLARERIVEIGRPGADEVKVDENLPRGTAICCNRAGHDAISVGEQGAERRRRRANLSALPGRATRADHARRRFRQRRAYDPKSSAGEIVLRLARQDRQRVLDAVARALPVLEREPLAKRLWIVEETRIRIRE